jgi:hypothetical protein
VSCCEVRRPIMSIASLASWKHNSRGTEPTVEWWATCQLPFGQSFFIPIFAVAIFK